MSNLRVVEHRRDLEGLSVEAVQAGVVEHGRLRGRITLWVPVVSGLVTVGLLALHFVLGMGLATVLSSSMRPTFAPGDAIITRNVSLTQIHPGQVIIYHPPGEDIKLAHRIVSLRWQGNRALIVTKGDANPTSDAPFFIGRSGGPVVIGTVPHLGTALSWVNPQRPESRALLVGLIGLFFTVGATRRAFRPSAGCSCRRCSEARPTDPDRAA